MKDKRIVFIAKTDINTDGRIINQINILLNKFKNIFIDFIILPDKNIGINLGDKVKFHPIKCSYRNSSLMRIFTIIEFTVKTLVLLRKLTPDIIHVQDSAGSLPILIYKIIYKNVTVIYDDHEIPNESSTFFEKMNVHIENKLIHKSDYLIEANEERLDLITEKLKLNNKPSTYFLNLPYESNDDNVIEPNSEIVDVLQNIDSMIDSGSEFILHQGPLKKERGRVLLANFSNCLKENQKILLVGGKKNDFDSFLNEFQISEEKFLFVGTVNYHYLALFWEKASFSVIMYLPTYLNNKLCAPNRFYLSLKFNIPTIVNKNNPVLYNLIKRFNNGFFVEDIIESSFEVVLANSSEINVDNYIELEKEQIKQFSDFYHRILS